MSQPIQNCVERTIKHFTPDEGMFAMELTASRWVPIEAKTEVKILSEKPRSAEEAFQTNEKIIKMRHHNLKVAERIIDLRLADMTNTFNEFYSEKNVKVAPTPQRKASKEAPKTQAENKENADVFDGFEIMLYKTHEDTYDRILVAHAYSY